MIALSFTLFDIAPARLTILGPAILVPVALIRSAALLRSNVDALTDNQIRNKLNGVVIFSSLLGPLFVFWSLALFRFGDAHAHIHIAFFICITSLVCINCLTPLRQSAAILAASSVGASLIYLTVGDVQMFKIIAVNIAIVVSAMIFMTMRTAKNFTDLIEKQSILSDQSRKLKALNEENMRLANLDSLTQLPNRRSYFTELKQAIEQCEKSSERLVVGILDLDGFKLVNDLFGHPTGDQLLIEVGKRLHTMLDDHICLARLGGDEFGLILRHPESDEELLQLGRDICQSLTAPFQLRDATTKVAASLGFASYPAAGHTADILFERADYALCYSKQNSKGDVVLFSNEHETIIREVSSIAHRLKAADLDQELSLMYQPIVNSLDGKIKAFEALARWHNPVLGNIPPNVFIRSAEQSGLINQLTVSLLAKALQAASKWPNDIHLSFNLSSFDICTPEHIMRLLAMIENSPVPANRIIFEITETAVMQNFERANESLTHIRQLGASIALDDFGTGFSSLSYVQRIKIDRLKVDRSFIQNIETDAASQDIVRTVADLCRNLNLQCIIEGVEKKSQLEVLENMGCNLFQGYYFAMPMSEADTLNYLNDIANPKHTVRYPNRQF
ncbi:MAG: EAL domain-containing protein [Rhizobiaceae bacterium]